MEFDYLITPRSQYSQPVGRHKLLNQVQLSRFHLTTSITFGRSIRLSKQCHSHQRWFNTKLSKVILRHQFTKAFWNTHINCLDASDLLASKRSSREWKTHHMIRASKKDTFHANDAQAHKLWYVPPLGFTIHDVIKLHSRLSTNWIISVTTSYKLKNRKQNPRSQAKQTIHIIYLLIGTISDNTSYLPNQLMLFACFYLYSAAPVSIYSFISFPLILLSS